MTLHGAPERKSKKEEGGKGGRQGRAHTRPWESDPSPIPKGATLAGKALALRSHTPAPPQAAHLKGLPLWAVTKARGQLRNAAHSSLPHTTFTRATSGESHGARVQATHSQQPTPGSGNSSHSGRFELKMMPGLGQEASPSAGEGTLGVTIQTTWPHFAEPPPLDYFSQVSYTSAMRESWQVVRAPFYRCGN